MKTACKEKRSEIDNPKKGVTHSTQELAVSKHLRIVADTFIKVQQKREEADYDTGKAWDPTGVDEQIAAVSAAFESWKAIRDEAVAQAYLVSLLGKRPRAE